MTYLIKHRTFTFNHIPSSFYFYFLRQGHYVAQVRPKFAVLLSQPPVALGLQSCATIPTLRSDIKSHVSTRIQVYSPQLPRLSCPGAPEAPLQSETH